MPRVNDTFEPIENGSTEPFSEEITLAHPVLLRTWEDVRLGI